MRRFVVLALLASIAHADDREFPTGNIAHVSGELRHTTAVFVARHAVHVRGSTYASSAIHFDVPATAVATSVVVHAPDGVHRLALVDAQQAKKSFGALGNGTGDKRWAVLVEATRFGLDVSVAAPHTATLFVDVELQMPTCFYKDARYAELPAAWKPVLSAQLRRASNRIGRHCRADRDDTDERLWIGFPDRSLAGTEQRMAANAARVDVGEAHLARLEVALAKTLADQPRDLATAFVVDASRSMRPAQLEAQRELVTAYARAAGESRVQLIAYARTPRALLPSWTTARAAVPRLDRELRAIAPRNGSNLDAALDEAARWLAQIEGTKRIVLFTDEWLPFRFYSLIASLPSQIPPNTLVHVVQVADAGQLARSWTSSLLEVAHATGGIVAGVGVPDDDEPIDPTLLLRATRIDALEITAPGWRRFRGPVASSCETELDEGASCVWWGEGDTAAGPLTIEGWIWGKQFTRVVTPDPGRAVELARELSTLNILDERAQARVEKLARAATTAWSFYGEWGPRGGYTAGYGSLHTRGGFSSRTARVPVVRIGRAHPGTLPAIELAPHLAGVVATCNLGDARVEAEVETTASEIVAVSVLAPPAVSRCVEEAIWETSLILPPPILHARTRVVLVH